MFEVIAIDECKEETVLFFNDHGVHLRKWQENDIFNTLLLENIWGVIAIVPELKIYYSSPFPIENSITLNKHLKEQDTSFQISYKNEVHIVNLIRWYGLTMDNATEIQEWWKNIKKLNKINKKEIQLLKILKEMKFQEANYLETNIFYENSSTSTSVNNSPNSNLKSFVNNINNEKTLDTQTIFNEINDELKEDYSDTNFSPKQISILNNIFKTSVLEDQNFTSDKSEWHEIRNIDNYINQLNEICSLDFEKLSNDSIFNRDILQHDMEDLEILLNEYSKLSSENSIENSNFKQKLLTKITSIKKRSELLKREINGEHIDIINKLKKEARKVELKHKQSATVIRNYYSKTLNSLQSKLNAMYSKYVNASSSISSLELKYSQLLELAIQDNIPIPENLLLYKKQEFSDANVNTDILEMKSISTQKSMLENAISVQIPSLGTYTEVPESVADAISRSLVTIDALGLITEKHFTTIGTQTLQQDDTISNFNFLRERLDTARQNYEKKLLELESNSANHLEKSYYNEVNIESVQLQLQKYKNLCLELKNILLQKISEEDLAPSIDEKLRELNNLKDKIVKEKEYLVEERIKLVEEQQKTNELFIHQKNALEKEKLDISKKLEIISQRESTIQKRSEQVDHLHKESLQVLQSLIEIESLDERKKSSSILQKQIEQEEKKLKEEKELITKFAVRLEVEKIICNMILSDIRSRWIQLEKEETHFHKRIENIFNQKYEEKSTQTIQFSLNEEKILLPSPHRIPKPYDNLSPQISQLTPRKNINQITSPRQFFNLNWNEKHFSLISSPNQTSYIERGIKIIQDEVHKNVSPRYQLNSSVSQVLSTNQFNENNFGIDSEFSPNNIISEYQDDHQLNEISQSNISNNDRLQIDNSNLFDLQKNSGITTRQAFNIAKKLQAYSKELNSTPI